MVTVRFVVLALAGWLASGGSVAAADLDLSARRRAVDEKFRRSLDALAEKCVTLQDKHPALKAAGASEITKHWHPLRDPRRLTLFLPTETDRHQPAGDAAPIVKFWYDHFMRYRQGQAKALFDLARDALAADRPAEAWRLLHEVLHEDPDHEEARRIVGYKQVNGRWRRAASVTTVRRATLAHPTFGFPARSYSRIETEHFTITSTADRADGLDLANRLEMLYDVLQQTFFRYWSSTSALQQRFDRPVAVRRSLRKHKVVLFRDRQQYLQTLGKAEPQIGVTTGFYSDGQRTAYFYAGDPTVIPTWYHEAAHQFFSESRKTADKPGEAANFWIVEGIALYVESLTHRGDYVTLGGFDANRLQFARYRALTEQFYVPLTELVKLGRPALQQHPQLRRLYSEAAGLAQFLMHHERGKYRESVIDYLNTVYSGKDGLESLGDVTAATPGQLDHQYHEFLNVTDDDLKYLTPEVQLTNLVLGRTQVTDAGLASLRGQRAIEWVDLSATKVSDAGVAHLADAASLTRLFLEGTAVTDAALPALTKLKRLQELDLTGLGITDDGLRHVGRATGLKVLWLGGTRVSDAGLRHLLPLKQLENIDIDQTSVTPAGLAQLKQMLPNLK